MPRLNRLEIIGHLGADPELKYTPSGKAVANLRVAVNNSRKLDDGSWSDDTMWVAVEVWEAAAERVAERLRKGNLVFAEGQLNVREYETRDGRHGVAVELKFARVQDLERRPRDEAGTEAPIADARPRGAPEREPVAAAAAPAPRTEPVYSGTEIDVDDIKF